LDDGAEDGSGAVGQAEFVVAGGQATPLFHVAVAAFDDVAAAVGLDVEVDRSASPRPAIATVLLLVAGVGDHGLDAATPQGRAGGAGRWDERGVGTEGMGRRAPRG